VGNFGKSFHLSPRKNAYDFSGCVDGILAFKVGQKVWLEVNNSEQDRPSEFFSDRCLGPYEILEKIGAASYKLKVPGLDFTYPVYNESLLSPYEEPPTTTSKGTTSATQIN
jgi:hypothetical protein